MGEFFVKISYEFQIDICSSLCDNKKNEKERRIWTRKHFAPRFGQRKKR